MNAPTRLVHRLAGSPEPIASVAALLTDMAGACAVCGQPSSRTAPVGGALGSNFTDRSMFRDDRSSRVCVACLWCCSGKPPATLRLWSIIAAPGVPASHDKAWLQGTPGLCLTNRANPRPVAAVLADPPDGEWLVTVATSGQKHVLPYGTVNTGRETWTVRMENTTVTSTPEQWRHMHTHAVALRRLGVGAADVFAGRPGALKTRDAVAAWREHSLHLARYTDSPLLDLALWTITKGTLDDR